MCSSNFPVLISKSTFSPSFFFFFKLKPQLATQRRFSYSLSRHCNKKLLKEETLYKLLWTKKLSSEQALHSLGMSRSASAIHPGLFNLFPLHYPRFVLQVNSQKKLNNWLNFPPFTDFCSSLMLTLKLLNYLSKFCFTAPNHNSLNSVVKHPLILESLCFSPH